jgi:hypothetical protein
MGATTQVTCNGCGSVYERRTQKIMVRDQDEEHCGVCGELLERWNASRIPSFHLLKRGMPKPKTDSSD